jgi:hypothetical protein
MRNLAGRFTLAVLALALVAFSAAAQTPVAVRTASAAWGSGLTASASIAAVAGDALQVGCNVPSRFMVTGATDSQGDIFALVQSQVVSTVSQSQYAFVATGIKGGTTKITCTANAAPGSGEIYVSDLGKVDPNNPVCASAAFFGVTGKASGSLKVPTANCLTLAYVVSGTVSNAVGWTALSTFDSNLVTSLSGIPANTIASGAFAASSNWSIIFVAYNPVAPPPPLYVYQLAGGPSVSFWMATPPTCGPDDGANCTITIQVTDRSGNVVASLAPGDTATISLVKTGAQGTQVTVVATAGPQ